MPQHLRLGVALESVALGVWVRLRSGTDPDTAAIERHLAGFERIPIGVVRQYPKLLASLVIFAQQELTAP